MELIVWGGGGGAPLKMLIMKEKRSTYVINVCHQIRQVTFDPKVN